MITIKQILFSLIISVVIAIVILIITFFIPLSHSESHANCGPHNNFCCCDQITDNESTSFGFPLIIKTQHISYGGFTGRLETKAIIKINIIINFLIYLLIINFIFIASNAIKNKLKKPASRTA